MTIAYNPARYMAKMMSKGAYAMPNSTIEGKVTRVNGTGFELEGQGWMNISKYAKPAPTMPRVGEIVVCNLDGSNFVRSVRVDEAAPENEPEKPAATRPAPAPSLDTKDLRITRLAVLNTATTIIAGTHGRANPDEVIELAARLEAWVLR